MVPLRTFELFPPVPKLADKTVHDEINDLKSLVCGTRFYSMILPFKGFSSLLLLGGNVGSK